jgi:hypothetical protein
MAPRPNKNLNNVTDVIDAHCIHREALVAKKNAHEIKKILQKGFTVELHLHPTLNSRLLSKFRKTMGSDHDKLLHAKIRWLSKGSVEKTGGTKRITDYF